jgi:hypothetical protein
MSCGLQAEAGGSGVKWNASADLTGSLMLHFTFESAEFISATANSFWQLPHLLPIKINTTFTCCIP